MTRTLGEIIETILLGYIFSATNAEQSDSVYTNNLDNCNDCRYQRLRNFKGFSDRKVVVEYELITQ
jgi:hypothetical protein